MAIIVGLSLRDEPSSAAKSSGSVSAPTMNGAVPVSGTYCFGTYTATFRVYDAGCSSWTTSLRGSFDRGVPNGRRRGRFPDRSLLFGRWHSKL